MSEKENKVMGLISNVKFIGSIGSGSSSGLYIEFNTHTPIKDGAVVNVNVKLGENKNWQTFIVTEVTISRNFMLQCTAKEYPSSKNSISNIKNLDIRDLIDNSVELIKDEKWLSDLSQESCYC